MNKKSITKQPLTPQTMGQRGGLARTKKLTKAQLSAIGKLGAKARWKKKGKAGRT